MDPAQQPKASTMSRRPSVMYHRIYTLQLCMYLCIHTYINTCFGLLLGGESHEAP